VAQSWSELHVAGQLSDEPLQTKPPPHGGLPAYPAVAGPHVPFAGAPSYCAQTEHVPVHVLPQQKPSTHAPFAQSLLPPGHAWPTTSLHTPLPSHICVPVQVPGSGEFVTGAQTPGFVVLHAWQVPQTELLQQTPSTQLPVSHCAPEVHVLPCA
jgi:hypothetical protein